MYVNLSKQDHLVEHGTFLFLLMIDLGILGSISYEGRVMYLSTLKNSKLWFKYRQTSALKFLGLIKVENIHQEHLKMIVK